MVQPLIFSLSHAVFLRGAAHEFLESTAEVLGILIAEGIGYLADGHVGKAEEVLGRIDHLVLDVLYGRLARLLLDEISEIVGREMELVCKPGHGGNANRWRTEAATPLPCPTLPLTSSLYWTARPTAATASR